MMIIIMIIMIITILILLLLHNNNNNNNNTPNDHTTNRNNNTTTNKRRARQAPRARAMRAICARERVGARRAGIKKPQNYFFFFVTIAVNWIDFEGCLLRVSKGGARAGRPLGRAHSCAACGGSAVQ